MTISAKRKWRSSERIALSFLEELGYRIIDTHVRIKQHGFEIAEIDAIVDDENGNRYAVEIKAGRIDVNGVRQAYVNAVVAGYKPLVVAKGYADDSARELADKLGVKVIQLSDYFLIEAEELENIIRDTITNTLADFLTIIAEDKQIPPEDLRLLEQIVASPTMKDLSEKLDLQIRDVVREIKRLQNKGTIPKNAKSYGKVRLYAAMRLAGYHFGLLKKLISSLHEQCSQEEHT